MHMVLILPKWQRKHGLLLEDEPLLLYPDVEEDDDDDDDANADYDVLSTCDNNDDNDEEDDINTLIHQGTHMPSSGSSKQASKMTSKFISKLISHLVTHNPEIPISKSYPRRPSIISGRFCVKWQEYTLSFSHVLVVYKDNGTRPDAYVADIYLRETYRRTYQSNFYPVGHENFWKDAPYNLAFYPPNMNN
ncbi:hypothetical protein M9H77_25462 [Catharanthus roseus]|uniref:Uncharacterized protein n=1 Tax=Catharanthus roseus TaxID=4058 RepID=A0ACC0A915_CATRO|nr:hypothetical protein M9H77_25462 [Catharanthus roseus]